MTTPRVEHFADTIQVAAFEICIDGLDNESAWAHEAGVFIPQSNELFVTSNRIVDRDGRQKVQIWKISTKGGEYHREEIEPGILMANGGTNYRNGVLFCSQGGMHRGGGIVYMEAKPPYNTELLVDSFHGRSFNSPNDVVVCGDGSIWFTDPNYGFEQGFRPRMELPNQVYRYEPTTKNIRVVADGFGKPNGLCFSPDEKTLYVTDSDFIHGDGGIDPFRASTIYAFDVTLYSSQQFLTNRRLFAMADDGIPDGIKCDSKGNVYSGCGDGINVWSAGGLLLYKIKIPGGVANFCFAREGEIYAMNERRLWRIQLLPPARGALLKL